MMGTCWEADVWAADTWVDGAWYDAGSVPETPTAPSIVYLAEPFMTYEPEAAQVYLPEPIRAYEA